MAASRVDLKRLGEVVGQFKNQDPALYEQFLRLLDAWTFEITVAVTEASSADILQAQGRAQQARKFMQVFSEVLEPKRATP